jgi:TPR repeat protein
LNPNRACAAGHSNSDAENQLGYKAEEGWAQPKNYVEALSWLYKAAEHGSEARFNLAKSDIGLVHSVQGKEQTLAKNYTLLPLVHGNSSE